MYIVQYTHSAHVCPPERSWNNGSRHRKLDRAAKATLKFRIPSPVGSWANNVRIIEENTGEIVPTSRWWRYIDQ